MNAFYSAISSQKTEWLSVYLSLNTLNDHKPAPLCIIIQHPWGKKNEEMNKYSLLILYVEEWVATLRKLSFLQ